MITLDQWQKEFIAERYDKILVSGRQTGKSEAAAYDAATFSITHKKKTVMIISKTERQAQELLLKTLFFINELSPNSLASGVDRPTKARIRLKNKSQVLSLPTGLAGEGIRGYTIHKLIADEAQLIEDDVYTAVTPMLLTTGGSTTLLGTPQGKKGFFWQAYENKLDQFKVFHVNSEEVIKNRPINNMTWPEWRRQAAIRHLEREKQRMSVKQYAQEYLGQFIEDLAQLFSDELIKKCCILKRPEPPIPSSNNYLGLDIARLGGDETTFQIIHRPENGVMRHLESIAKKRRLTTDTEKDILHLNQIWNFSKIGIDAGAGALGVGIFDRLREYPGIKRKVIPMNNRSISMDKENKQKQRIFKEDMYDNLLALMEKGEILLLDDDEVIASLKSIQFEHMERGRFTSVKIFGAYSHITEGLIRAAWLAQKEKARPLWLKAF